VSGDGRAAPRRLACARCGAAFDCGVGADPASPCFCARIPLDDAQRAELRARYDDCLCETCLRSTAAAPPLRGIQAITIDLDDTLWPVRPPLEAAERRLADWLARHAPATAHGMGPGAMLALRAEVAAEHPHWAHDLSAIRLETIRRALVRHGDDPRLAQSAFDDFLEARHQVALYDDVRPALARLAARFRLVGLSNGNAEIARVGLGGFFVGAVSARAHGAAKPAASIFHAACAAAGAAPHAVLHLGDDPALDVDAALAAGLHAGWIVRPDGAHGGAGPRPRAHRFADLLEVARALGA
jgi:putative hydrolase of the HAD superfamily